MRKQEREEKINNNCQLEMFGCKIEKSKANRGNNGFADKNSDKKSIPRIP